MRLQERRWWVHGLPQHISSDFTWPPIYLLLWIYLFLWPKGAHKSTFGRANYSGIKTQGFGRLAPRGGTFKDLLDSPRRQYLQLPQVSVTEELTRQRSKPLGLHVARTEWVWTEAVSASSSTSGCLSETRGYSQEHKQHSALLMPRVKSSWAAHSVS